MFAIIRFLGILALAYALFSCDKHLKVKYNGPPKHDVRQAAV